MKDGRIDKRPFTYDLVGASEGGNSWSCLSKKQWTDWERSSVYDRKKITSAWRHTKKKWRYTWTTSSFDFQIFCWSKSVEAFITFHKQIDQICCIKFALTSKSDTIYLKTSSATVFTTQNLNNSLKIKLFLIFPHLKSSKKPQEPNQTWRHS